jgi:hypothetical protein
MLYTEDRKVLYADNSIAADPILCWLRDNGVQAWLIDEDDLGGLDPALAFVHGCGIVVHDRDAERARNLISTYQQATIEPTAELGGDEA